MVSCGSPIPSPPPSFPHTGCDWGSRTPPCLFQGPHIWISSSLGRGRCQRPVLSTGILCPRAGLDSADENRLSGILPGSINILSQKTGWRAPSFEQYGTGRRELRIFFECLLCAKGTLCIIQQDFPITPRKWAFFSLLHR